MQRDFSRQDFLGQNSEMIIAKIPVSFIGLSGGGSHEVQQAAHIGFETTITIDPDTVSESNLNRDVLADRLDAEKCTPKVETAKRKILSLAPQAKVTAIVGRWQAHQKLLMTSSIVFGCVDSFDERDQLERFCRRFLITYIDIGMDVITAQEKYKIVGQVAVSLPGGPCFRCMNIITEERLKREAEKYGEAGVKPQVVWPNGVLASTAIGIAMQMICPWHDEPFVGYYEYNGNSNTIAPSSRWPYVQSVSCPHYPAEQVGDPLFDLGQMQLP